MAQNIQELQRNGILRMLNLSSQGDQTAGAALQWKALVFDKFCMDVIAPLIKVGGLRSHGVTLQMSITNERSQVKEIPAIYFVEPTEENVKRICMDLEKGLYQSCYINFASAVPRQLLEDLAKGALETRAANKIAGVFDRYTSFVSLSPSLFALNLPSAYHTINSPHADEIIEQYIERIVDGLLSVLISTKSLPVIRCPPNNAAEAVGRRLEERIRDLIARGSATAELFSGGTGGPMVAAGGEGAGNQRPLLCILDRDVDLVAMLHHTWTYQAMVHDVLGMKLNKVNVPVDSGGDSSAPPKTEVYDIDESDAFWAAHAGDAWTDAASAVSDAIEEFKTKRENVTGGDGGAGETEISRGLAAAINAMPEMKQKKRSIDIHTNTITAIMREVKARELDRYFDLEDQFVSQSTGTSVSQLEQLINDHKKGTALDKTRALMVLYLSKQQSLSAAQLETLTEALRNANGEVHGLGYLQHAAGIRQMTVPQASGAGAAQGPGGAASLMGSFAGGLADKMMKLGEGGISNIKNIVTAKKEMTICQIMDSVMEQKPGGMGEQYIYLDPKAPAGMEPPRMRAPFRRAIAFVVGGGNYAEMQSLQEWAQARKRNVIYGSTDLVSPEQFVEELRMLGADRA